MREIMDHDQKVLLGLRESVHDLDTFLAAHTSEGREISIGADDYHELNALMESLREAEVAWEALGRRGSW
jgi:hypothetical protein